MCIRDSPGFWFAHPGFNSMGGQRPPADLNKSLFEVITISLSTLSLSRSVRVPPAYQFVCMMISNRNILAVKAVYEFQVFQ